MKFLIMIALMNLTSNCTKDKLLKDDELSIKVTDYKGNKLKLDGYFYQQKNKYYYDIYCFYNNGILLAAGGTFLSVAEMDDYLNREFINNKSYQIHKSNWGVFILENNNIKFERWYPGDPPLKAHVREGTIANDSTFTITESYRIQKGKKTEVIARSETFHFKAFSPKPDSTNKFIP